MIQIKIKEINQEYNSIYEENLRLFIIKALPLTEIGHNSAYPIDMHVDYE